MNLLNEEIRVIQHTLSHMKRGLALESDQAKRIKMKKDIKELDALLDEKLEQCGDYKG